MPSIDYTSMNAQASALGAKRGRAEGQIQQQRDRQERKVRMEQRYAQMAQDKARHQNELAKTEFAQVSAAKIAEDQAWGEASSKGLIDDKGTYTQKHWKEQAFDKYVNSGVTRTSKDMKHFYDKIDHYVKTEQSGATAGMTRQYASGDAEINLQRKLQYNADVEMQEGTREHREGIDASINTGLDKLLGTEQIEQPEMQRSIVTGEGHGRLAEYNGNPTFAEDAKPSEGKLEDFQTVEALDSDGNPIAGRTYRMATDEQSRQAYILKDGKWEEAAGEYQTVDKTKTGTGLAKVNDFKSPLQSKEFIKKSGFEGRAVKSLDALFKTVSSKMSNPKDFADRMFESMGNTLSAVVGFDGTEGEIVEQYLNATTEEDKAVIKSTMGFGVSDAIHKGQADQRELFATLHLARALAGTGKLSVNAMDAAREITNGGSGTSSLSKLEGSRKSMQNSLQRSIISQAGHHNIQLSSMRPSAEKDRVERTQGYPVFSSNDYRKQMQQLGYSPDKKVVDQLDKMFKAEKVFFNDEHGRTMAPTIVKYTTEQGEDAFTIGIRPQHYE